MTGNRVHPLSPGLSSLGVCETIFEMSGVVQLSFLRGAMLPQDVLF